MLWEIEQVVQSPRVTASCPQPPLLWGRVDTFCPHWSVLLHDTYLNVTGSVQSHCVCPPSSLTCAHRCWPFSPSAHRNGGVFTYSFQRVCCSWILNRGKNSCRFFWKFLNKKVRYRWWILGPSFRLWEHKAVHGTPPKGITFPAEAWIVHFSAEYCYW